MEEPYTTRFMSRERDLQKTAARRASRRRARAERYAQASDIGLVQRGPYEASYDVATGYCCERTIDRP